HGADQPVLQVGGEPQRGGAPADRQQRQVLLAVVGHLLEHGAGAGVAGGGAAAGGVLEDPVPEAHLEGAAVAHALVAHVAHGVDGDDGGQVGRAVHGQGVLRAADVRRAEHADLAVGPGLLRDPGGGVGAVGAVVGQPVPDAVGAVPAAGVLGDEGVAAGGEVLAGRL